MKNVSSRQPTFISAIVPVFNEEKTIKNVLEVLLRHPKINEIICINDGSEDNSLKILKSYRGKIYLINCKKNHGKGFALAKGVEKAKNNIVTFFDADLTNLSFKHVDTLINPLINSKSRAVVGVSSAKSYLSNILSKLSGERAYYKKDLWPILKKMKKSRFGVEMLLNNYFMKSQIRIVVLKNLTGLLKYEKRTAQSAFQEYVGEIIEIGKELARQQKIIPNDLKIMKRLTGLSSVFEFEEKVKKIQNVKLRSMITSYIVRVVKQLT